MKDRGNWLRNTAVLTAVTFIGLAAFQFNGALATAQSESGRLPFSRNRTSAPTSINPVVTETGKISLSIDGLGTLDATGMIDVMKPAGATVRKAYLAAASTGGTNRVLVNGDVKINGQDVIFTVSTPSSIRSSNHFADVTSIVKPIVDAAAAGIVTLTISEVNSLGIDGELLAVIFDDPNQTTDNTALILFGAQNVDGDTFNITLAQPINDPTLPIDMSLGISFGLQGVEQASIINVNGARLTSSAGGQDDRMGSTASILDGSLVTVGGIGDSNANPANPNSGPNGDPRQDDELYDLRPFVRAGTTNISVFTQNPSNDDNIFFAGFFFKGALASPGCGTIAVSPGTIPPLVRDLSYSQAFTASGGNAPYTFALTGALPAGLTFANGVLSGTPTQTGDFPITITATDANNCRGSNSYVLAVSNNCVLPPSGLTSWWPGDGNADDITGSNLGALRNGASFAAGKVGPAFSLDGVNDSILVGHSASLNLNEHTIDAWINPGAQQGAAFHGIVVKQNSDNSGRNYYLGLRNDGRIHYSISFPASLSSIDSRAVIPTDTWTHVAATFDGSVMRIFINGQENASLNVGNVTPVKTTQPLLIGHTNENAATFFKGVIDEVEIFNRALSAQEISSIFNADRAGKCRDCRQVYSNNFEGGARVGPEWRVYDTCGHERCNSTPLGLSGEAFLGRYRFFANESCTPRAPTDPDNRSCPDNGGTVRRLNENDVILTVDQNTLGNHNAVNVSFDLYIIERWSGSQNETWELRYDNGENTQRTLLASRRFTNTSGLQRQPFNLTFAHPNGRPLRLIFSARGLRPVDEASWGLDNVAVTTCSGVGSCANFSAASYTAPLASEAIATAFGAELATTTTSAREIPLPPELGGTTVKVRDGAGVERVAPLFFVSPLQVNYQVPPGTVNGTATVNVTSADGSAPVCLAQISTVAPGLFTADASGRGLPAASVLRVSAGGSQIYEPVARFDPATNKFVVVPIDLDPATDQVFLILYGTGIRYRSGLSAVTVTVGGENAQALYAGAQGGFVGLDQVNVLLPRSLIGRGEVDVILTVNGQGSNTVKINIK